MKRSRSNDEPRRITLVDSQAIAFSKIVASENLFLTGSAGTGKSEVVKEICRYWSTTGTRFKVCATTGIAALAINGQTFHSFMRTRPGDDDLSALQIIKRMKDEKKYTFFALDLKNLDAIIVDEVSMMSPDFFEKCSEILKLVRQNGSPFGGLQVLFTGDFFQLGPIGSKKFLFESAEFTEMFSEKIVLKKVFRQKDSQFIELLARVRVGELLDSDIELLKSRVGLNVSEHGIEPTELWCTNKDVDTYNNAKLAQIKSEPRNYKENFGIHGRSEKKQMFLDFFKKEHLANLILKGPEIQKDDAKVFSQMGAQVMLTSNLDPKNGLVNGSRGVIVDFEYSQAPVDAEFLDLDDDDEYKAYVKDTLYPVVRFIVNGKPLTKLVPLVKISKAFKDAKAYVWLMPLKLAWATTIHKSQGLSLDRVRISLDHTVFAEGQAYVALSRVRSIEGLSLVAFEAACIKANAKVKEFYSTIL